MQGIIALDIDGTITGPDHQVPEEVATFLHQLADQGWSILFVTGRTFSFGFEALKNFSFPYYFGVYNGALLLRMPVTEVVIRHYLPGTVIDPLVDACAPYGLEPVIHMGLEFGDRCYWRPAQFDEEMRSYLKERHSRTTEPWHELESFDDVPIDYFAYAKVFGPNELLDQIELPDFGVSHIQDPLHPTHGLLLITHPAATKGGTLSDFRLLTQKFFAIAAGDDLNDLSMLQCADVSIAMENAPEEVRAVADIIAPPASEQGIIPALKEAIARR